MKYPSLLLSVALTMLPLMAAEKDAAKTPAEIPPSLQILALQAIESDFCTAIPSFAQLSRTDHVIQKQIASLIEHNRGLPKPKRMFFAKEVRNFTNLSTEKYKKSRAALEKVLKTDPHALNSKIVYPGGNTEFAHLCYFIQKNVADLQDWFNFAFAHAHESFIKRGFELVCLYDVEKTFSILSQCLGFVKNGKKVIGEQDLIEILYKRMVMHKVNIPFNKALMQYITDKENIQNIMWWKILQNSTILDDIFPFLGDSAHHCATSLISWTFLSIYRTCTHTKILSILHQQGADFFKPVWNGFSGIRFLVKYNAAHYADEKRRYTDITQCLCCLSSKEFKVILNDMSEITNKIIETKDPAQFNTLLDSTWKAVTNSKIPTHFLTAFLYKSIYYQYQLHPDKNSITHHKLVAFSCIQKLTQKLIKHFEVDAIENVNLTNKYVKGLGEYIILQKILPTISWKNNSFLSEIVQKAVSKTDTHNLIPLCFSFLASFYNILVLANMVSTQAEVLTIQKNLQNTAITYTTSVKDDFQYQYKNLCRRRGFLREQKLCILLLQNLHHKNLYLADETFFTTVSEYFMQSVRWSNWVVKFVSQIIIFMQRSPQNSNNIYKTMFKHIVSLLPTVFEYSSEYSDSHFEIRKKVNFDKECQDILDLFIRKLLFTFASHSADFRTLFQGFYTESLLTWLAQRHEDKELYQIIAAHAQAIRSVLYLPAMKAQFEAYLNHPAGEK